VRRGHKVQLYRYADTDEFFWEVLTDAGGLMKLETVTHSYSGTADENATNDASNSYFTHISTHDGLVAIHTSKANNEPYGYDGQINTAQGVVQLQDDIGNSFYMNSKEHQLEVQNADGALISMKGPDIVINAPASLTIKAGTTITINGVGITIDGSGNVNITSPNTTVN